MKTITDSKVLENATFFGVVGGLAMLVVCYFAADLRFLAVPALAVLVPSFLYGMR